MPGFGPVLGASLLVGAGDLRAFPSAGHLAAAASMLRVGPNRDYYLKKREQGRTHSQAVIALARRRVDVLWALLRENRTWTTSPPAVAQAA
jgi:hypothetical protein